MHHDRAKVGIRLGPPPRLSMIHIQWAVGRQRARRRGRSESTSSGESPAEDASWAASELLELGLSARLDRAKPSYTELASPVWAIRGILKRPGVHPNEELMVGTKRAQ